MMNLPLQQILRLAGLAMITFLFAGCTTEGVGARPEPAPMPSAVQSALKSGDILAAQAAANAVGYTLPPELQKAADEASAEAERVDGSHRFPAWSPDGRHIAWKRYSDGHYDVYVMDAEGANIRQVTADSRRGGAPAWSPDGTQIVFEGYRGGGFGIFVMDADGGNLRQLIAHPRNGWSPA